MTLVSTCVTKWKTPNREQILVIESIYNIIIHDTTMLTSKILLMFLKYFINRQEGEGGGRGREREREREKEREREQRTAGVRNSIKIILNCQHT